MLIFKEFNLKKRIIYLIGLNSFMFWVKIVDNIYREGIKRFVVNIDLNLWDNLY